MSEKSRRLRLIWDDGTPACLPDWARDEIVRRRLRMTDLHRQNMELRMQLAELQGKSPGEVMAAILSEPW